MCLGSVCPQPPYNDKNTPLFRHRSRLYPKRLRCFVVGCNNEYSSRHLLPTSEGAEAAEGARKWIIFALEGNEPPIYLNASMVEQIICDPALPTEVYVLWIFVIRLS